MEQPNGHASQPTSPDQGDGRSLLSKLEELGDSIVTADIPVDVRKVLGALVRFVETGSLEPPAAPAPVEEQRFVHEAESENLRLQQRIRELEGTQADAAAPPVATPPFESPAAPVAGAQTPGQPLATPAQAAAAVPAEDPAKQPEQPPATVIPPVPGSVA